MSARLVQLSQTGRGQWMSGLDGELPPMRRLGSVRAVFGILTEGDHAHLVSSLGIASFGGQAQQTYTFPSCTITLPSEK